MPAKRPHNQAVLLNYIRFLNEILIEPPGTLIGNLKVRYQTDSFIHTGEKPLTYLFSIL